MTSFAFETPEDRVVYRATRMFGITGIFGSLMRHLERCGEAYGADFAEYCDQGERLLLQDADFTPGSGQRKSMELDDAWSEWAANVSYHLQDAALDLNFSPEKQMLYDFLFALSAGRSVIA